MKEKRKRDKARDEAEKEKLAIESGEQTDWKKAMEEWNEMTKNEKGGSIY